MPRIAVVTGSVQGGGNPRVLPARVVDARGLTQGDVALLKEMSDMGLFSAAFSVPTIDEKAWRASEPRTPNPYARLEAAADPRREGLVMGDPR